MDACRKAGIQVYPVDGQRGERLEIQAAEVAGLLVVNVYVYNDPPQAAWDDLETLLEEYRAQGTGPTVLMGDFNPPKRLKKRDAQIEFFRNLGARLGLSPVVTLTTHEKGRILDQIVVSPEVQVQATGQRLVAGCDHNMVWVDVAAPGRLTRPLETQRRIKWKALDTLTGEQRQELAAVIAQGAEVSDLGVLNKLLLSGARRILGTYEPRLSLRKEWWKDPEATAALKAWRAYVLKLPKDRGKWQDHARKKARKLYRAFRRAQRLAACLAKHSRIEKIRLGRLDLAFQVLGKRSRTPRTAALNPEEAKAHWEQVWTPSDGQSAKEVDPIVQHISFEVSPGEVLEAIKATKVKAAGPDGVSVRFLKAFCNELAPVLAVHLSAALSDPPAELKRGETILLPKGSGVSRDPGKYRPITLLPVLQRLLARIVDGILRKAVRELGIEISPTQAWFMPGRSCHEQAILFHLLQADAVAYYSPLHAVLLDVARAFDSLHHGQLLAIMQEIGFPPKYRELVRRMLMDSETEINGEVVKLLRGAPQGSPCSPFLATIYFESLARAIRAYVKENPQGVQGAAERLGVAEKDHILLALIQFADDHTLLGVSRKWLQGLLDVVTAWADRCHLQFNASKSSVTALTAEARRDQTPLKVQSHPIPQERRGKLLGVPFQEAGLPKWTDMKAEAVASIRGSMFKLKELFTIRRRAGRRANEVLVDFVVLRMALQQVVLPRVLYAAPVVQVDAEAVDRCLRTHLRAVLGLPTTFPSNELHWLLRIWPTEHHIAAARLKLAWKCYHQFWVKDIIRHLRNSDSHHHHYLLQHGPLGLLTDALESYGLSWDELPGATTRTMPRPTPKIWIPRSGQGHGTRVGRSGRESARTSQRKGR
jgi:hypothetical protein